MEMMKQKHVSNFMRGAIRILMRERRAQMLGHGQQPYDENIHTKGTSTVSQTDSRSFAKRRYRRTQVSGM
jgi:hypothetical protein